MLEGKFTNNEEVVRETALCTSDEDHNVDVRFTLKAPKLTIKSPNTILAAGIFEGDVYVESNNFTLTDGFTVKGNVYFQKKKKLNQHLKFKVVGMSQVILS